MVLTIKKENRFEDCFYFEGYYIHPQKGLVTSKEESLDYGYLKENKMSLNGMFRMIIVKDGTIEVIVDRYRSMPVFYICCEECLIVSTNFFELCEEAVVQGVEVKVNGAAADNYIRFGYVPHENTLVEEIKELPCGSFMKINLGDMKFKIEKYWKFEYIADSDFKLKDERKKLKNIYDDIFKDYCKYINRVGKKVNFAISGGLDSRLVLGGILKFIDDKSNVVLNTFGNIYADDVKIPYRLAEDNGLELNHLSISEFNNMFEENTTMTNATQGRSLSHYQDGFPLVENGKIQRDDVWFFGHTGDFIGGGHISRKVYYAPYEKYRNKFREMILQKHSFDKLDNKWYSDQFAQMTTKEEFLSELDRWDMENRQSKFIMNDAATYREHDNFVFLPLWDNRLVDYFLRVPLEYKVERVIYNDVSIDYLKELNLNKYLGKSYYKKDTLLYLIRNKFKLMTKPTHKFMLSHGFNVFFSMDYTKKKIEKVIMEIKEKGIEIHKSKTEHFNHYLALIELNKICSRIEKIKKEGRQG